VHRRHGGCDLRRASRCDQFVVHFVSESDAKCWNYHSASFSVYPICIWKTIYVLQFHLVFSQSGCFLAKLFSSPALCIYCVYCFIVYFWVPLCSVSVLYAGAYRRGGGVWGVKTPPKFRSFAKAEPNSQFRGIYIRNNPIRIWVS
jgi:hypothetical protein